MMKLILIRHAEVDFEWPKKCSSREFDDACKRYDTAGIRTDGVKPAKGTGYCIITSSQDRAKETARLMFGKAPVIESDLFDEVPLVSFRDTEKRLPKWLFDVMGRLQWLFGSERQPESRRQTIDRAKKAVALIDRQGSDCVVISHGFFMRSLLRVYARGKDIPSPEVRILPFHRCRESESPWQRIIVEIVRITVCWKIQAAKSAG